MLKNLTITNFQSHRDTRVDFDPCLTVLVGSSNHGKTAVLRALCWIARNRPRGSAFIRHGADAAEVRLEADGAVIVRRKGRKGVNEYVVDGEVLTALGADVPPQVADRLNLGAVNLADQLDRHFLLLDPPGQIARTINEAIHLDSAEAVAQAAAAEVRDAKARAKDLAARAQAVEASVAAMAWLDGAREGVEAAKKVSERHARSLTRRDGLRRLLGDLAVVGRDLAGGLARVAIESAGSTADLVEAVVVGIGRKRETLTRLASLLHSVRAVGDGLAALGEVPEVDIDGLDADARGWGEKARRLNRLVDVLDGLTGLADTRAKLCEQLGKAMEDERDLLGQLTECPACGQELTEEAQRRLLE